MYVGVLMKTVTSEDLNHILEDHSKWIKSSGNDGIQADLAMANLRGADLHGADLRGANLRGANLARANLSAANLSAANLVMADLRGADFRGADLSGVNLVRADLRGANISIPIACPEEGSFIGFKKALNKDNKIEYIIKLEIPEDALRSSATTRKCRCSKAKVLSITNLDGTDADTDVAYSSHDPSFIYKIGEIVEVPDFNTDRWKECSTGIHFFITRQEAVDY